ncbi:MAG: F0F1 ATP synthase subunit gamma [Sandaracinaceae bacterium]
MPTAKGSSDAPRCGARSAVHLGGGEGPALLVVVGGELGLSGSYDSRVVDFAVERRAGLGDGPTFAVGQRAGTLMSRRGISIEKAYRGPTSIGGIPARLLPLAEDVLTRWGERGLSRIEIVSSRFVGVGATTPTSTVLLPLEPRVADPALPTPRYVAADRFASVAVRELFYVTLYDLLLDALATEHGARLVATQSAERWLDERTARLRRRLAAARREASTQEVIEIAAGARARRTA